MGREDKHNLLIHILWNYKQDKEFSSDKCEDLKKELDKIKGIRESFFTEGSDVSDIAALAEWTEEETKRRIEEIRKIKNVRDVDVRILVPA
jgi:hypothetical protein